LVRPEAGTKGEWVKTQVQGKTPSHRASIPQRQLAVRLQSARDAAGLTQEAAAKLLRIHTVTLSKIENGRSSVKPAVVREMARIYGIPAAETERLVDLSDDARSRGWTVSYRDVIPEPVSALADIEARASSIFEYETEILPATLQTPEYAAYVIDLAVGVPAERRRQHLAFRLERQQRLLTRDPRPNLRFVVHESVLRARIGDDSLMHDQFAHLVSLSRQRGIEVRVWPFSAGLHQWMSGAFTLLQSGDESYPHVVYTENQVEGRYFENQGQVEQYARMFGEIRRKATPIKEFTL
jgi:transcriptional regulator with XRE-family HTH domain